MCVCMNIYRRIEKNIIPEVQNQEEEIQWDIAEILKLILLFNVLPKEAWTLFYSLTEI